MGQFYGIFQDIKELNMGGITELGIYEGIFSNVYANMKNSAQGGNERISKKINDIVITIML